MTQRQELARDLEALMVKVGSIQSEHYTLRLQSRSQASYEELCQENQT